MLIEPHPLFTREGDDLFVDVTLSLADVIFGATIEVPTMEEPKKVKIKPGTLPGTKVRLRGFGVPAHGKHHTGDLYAVLRVRVPSGDELTDDERAAIESLRARGY